MIIDFPAERVSPIRRVLFPRVVKFQKRASPMEQALVVPALTAAVSFVAWIAFFGFMFQVLGLTQQPNATKCVARNRG